MKSECRRCYVIKKMKRKRDGDRERESKKKNRNKMLYFEQKNEITQINKVSKIGIKNFQSFNR